MRLGVVGMTPADFRDLGAEHLDAIADLDLTGVGFHAPGDRLGEVTAEQCRRVRGAIDASDVDLVQFGIGYGECLFDPDPGVREAVLGKIRRGIEVAAELEAHACLIRTGSLNPRGSYCACRQNHLPESRRRLVESLRIVAAGAEANGVTIVIETHLLTILDSPETNAAVLDEVGSARMNVVMDCVNHFQTLSQVYDSRARLDHIFAHMGPISCLGHLKDLKVRDGLVLHLDEEVPGDGELDLGYLLQLWHGLYPEGYMLLEHLPTETYPRAASNAHRIAMDAGVEIH